MEKVDQKNEIPQLLAEHFEQEIRQKNNAIEVSKRLAGESGISRKAAYTVLYLLSEKFAGQEDIINQLISEYNKEPSTIFGIAAKLHTSGNSNLALRYFTKAFTGLDVAKASSHVLQKASRAAMDLGQHEQAAILMEALFTHQKEHAADTSEFIGHLNLYAQAGHNLQAIQLWQKLLQARPRDGSLVKKYYRFLKDYGGSKPEPTVVTVDIAPGPYSEKLLEECAADFRKGASNEAVSKWASKAKTQAFKHNNMITANRLWSIILTYAPHCTSSFFRFSREFNIQGSNEEIDELIRWAHALHSQNENDSHNELFTPITIDGAERPLDQWLFDAGNHMKKGYGMEAFHLYIGVLRQKITLVSCIVEDLVKIASVMSPDHFVAELCIAETLKTLPTSVGLYQSLVTKLYKILPSLGEKIFVSLQDISPTNPGNKYVMSNALLQRNKFREAAELWLPLDANFAPSCATFASHLADKGKHELARVLFAEIAKVSPALSIEFGYKFFSKSGMKEQALDCIESLVPKGDEGRIEQHQIFALRLFMRHGQDRARCLKIVEALLQNNALSLQEANIIRSIQPQHTAKSSEAGKSNHDDQDSSEQAPYIDEEIENYLRQHLPTLKTGKFFQTLEERQPLIKPGKKTDRTARRVLGKKRPSDNFGIPHAN